MQTSFLDPTKLRKPPKNRHVTTKILTDAAIDRTIEKAIKQYMKTPCADYPARALCTVQYTREADPQISVVLRDVNGNLAVYSFEEDGTLKRVGEKAVVAQESNG
jgi:hypothetical protein